jgi:hypothetical protein
MGAAHIFPIRLSFIDLLDMGCTHFISTVRPPEATKVGNWIRGTTTGPTKSSASLAHLLQVLTTQ